MKMAAILDAILDFEECQQGISGDFLSVILHIFLDLSWKNQLVTKNVQVKTNIIGLSGKASDNMTRINIASGEMGVPTIFFQDFRLSPQMAKPCKEHIQYCNQTGMKCPKLLMRWQPQNKQTNKQTNKNKNKKQTNKQTNKQNKTNKKLTICSVLLLVACAWSKVWLTGQRS